MSYRNDFLEAFLARKKYIPDAAPEKYFSYEDLKSFDVRDDSRKAAASFHKIDDLFQRVYIPDRIGHSLPIANACHTVCYHLVNWLISTNACDARDLAYTVGDVSFHGKWMYNVSEENLKETLAKGRDTSSDVNVHAWLTYRTNYVFDPTILFTLADWDLYDLDSSPNRLQLWSDYYEELRWELDYKPILVDSDFFNRVDELI